MYDRGRNFAYIGLGVADFFGFFGYAGVIYALGTADEFQSLVDRDF